MLTFACKASAACILVVGQECGEAQRARGGAGENLEDVLVAAEVGHELLGDDGAVAVCVYVCMRECKGLGRSDSEEAQNLMTQKPHPRMLASAKAVKM